MATIVFLHAHPDDEATSSGGSIARAVSEGHRVVCVFGTNGDHGEVPDDLAPGESLVDRRRAEAERAASVLGTQRVAWLGYADSGMTGWRQNLHPEAFANADLDEAAGRLARILDQEDADLVIGYDWHGSYGHPDHVKVHHVAKRAAALARRTPRWLQVTMNRDRMRRLARTAAEAGFFNTEEHPFDVDAPADDGNPFGTPEAELNWAVDVSPFVGQKARALACHASQVTDVGMFMSLPTEAFALMFGMEYYIEHARPAGMVEGWIL